MEKKREGAYYKYPRPALAVDAVVFGLDSDGQLKILLIQRKIEPFLMHWALPGGFVRVGESAEEAVYRELQEETSVELRTLKQVTVFSEPDRDPREHVVTIAYLGLLRLSEHELKAASDAALVAWFALDELPLLAFDHEQIISRCLKSLRSMTDAGAIGMDLLPEKFPLRSLQSLYEQILGHPLDRRNFRRQIIEQGMVSELQEYETDVQHRAARLYCFNPSAVGS